MVKLMGEKYNLTEDELEQMRSLLISAISFTVGNIFELYMALVWLYEYMEIWAVNNTNLNANKRVVSNFFNVEPTLVTALFRLRGAIVHRPCDVPKYFNLLINHSYVYQIKDIFKMLLADKYNDTTVEEWYNYLLNVCPMCGSKLLSIGSCVSCDYKRN